MDVLLIEILALADPEFVALSRWIVKVARWHPGLLLSNQEVPSARDPVNKHEEEEEELDHTEANLETLLELEIPQDPTKSQQPH